MQFKIAAYDHSRSQPLRRVAEAAFSKPRAEFLSRHLFADYSNADRQIKIKIRKQYIDIVPHTRARLITRRVTSSCHCKLSLLDCRDTMSNRPQRPQRPSTMQEHPSRTATAPVSQPSPGTSRKFSKGVLGEPHVCNHNRTCLQLWSIIHVKLQIRIHASFCTLANRTKHISVLVCGLAPTPCPCRGQRTFCA